jgi:ADP-ribose pyrophosphatase YjhB (NUDIX family)
MKSYVKDLRKLVGSRPLILPGACTIILDEEGRLLLQRRTDDSAWGLPGGMMEMGESLEETARREVKEEVGLDVTALTLFHVFSGLEVYHQYPNGDKVWNVVTAFIANEWHGTLKSDGVESSEAAFFRLDEIPEQLSLDGVVIRAYIHEQGCAE